jgi:short-subunit dehydrogenase
MTAFADRYGPWAVIAGASDGTGRCFAQRIAAQGVNCVLVGRRLDRLDVLAEQLRAAHQVECVTASIDLYDPGAAVRVAEVVGEREVGLFVANAGGDTNSSHFLDQDIEAWVDLVNRNVVTLMRCCHQFGRGMRERRRGGLLLVGSGACYGGASFLAAYAGSKAFDLCFSEGLWAELRGYDVDVLYLVLGRTDTPSFRANLAHRGLPVPPNLADPDDVARVGLERLPHGPIHNWGQDDSAGGPMIGSAAGRRERVLTMEQAMKGVVK